MKIKAIRVFDSIAETIRLARLRKGMSQGTLSRMLGYKNGQYISNMERGLCSLPISCINSAAKLLEIKPEAIITAMVEDYEATLRSNTLKESQGV